MEETRDDTLDRLRAQLSDRYQVERKLGAGGMAAVYLAKDLKHDRQVAIKVLHPELAATIGGERFEREIKTAAKLQHPNILTMFDSGVADGLLFYVMPFVEGESLRDRLDRETQLPVEDAIQITLEVADALGHAHAKGIIHRDIKPDNVMLSGGHALVADFGIARAAGEGTEKLTSTGMSVGTPTYMAPEQAVGESVGPTADLYSLGCMLYEMLAGEPPFTGKNGAAIMAKHAMEAVPSVRIVRQSVPEEVEQAIFAAMGKVPADRPQTAMAFMDILGIPMGSTATRRIVGRVTSTHRVPTGAQPVLELPAPLWKRPWVVAAAVLVIAAGSFAAYKAATGSGAPSDDPTAGGLDKRQVAVLYFDDESRDSSLKFVADGLTEGLIANLATVQGLSVISAGGSEQMRGATLALDSIARILRAGTLVRGSVEPVRDQLRITVRLVDGVSGSEIDRKSFPIAADQFVAAKDSLAATVAGLLRTALGEEIARSQSRAETRSSAAWSVAQRADQLRRRGEAAAAAGDLEAMNREFLAADSLLAEAERLDASWVRPIVARGQLDYRRSRLVPRNAVAIKPWLDSGMVDANRALAKAPNDPDALELRGNLQYWGLLVNLYPDAAEAQRVLLAAQADFERATQINPQQAGAWASLSHSYYRNGTTSQVNIAASRALEADAFLSNADVVLDRLFLSSYDLDQYPAAENWCRELQRRFPQAFISPRCGLYLMTMRDGSPKPDSAWKLADTLVALAPQARRALQRLSGNQLVAAVLARASRDNGVLADSARRVVEANLGNAEVDPTRDLHNTGAFVYTILGDTTQAVRLLGVYLAANPQRILSYAQDPGWWFRPIMNDRRFKALVGSAR